MAGAARWPPADGRTIAECGLGEGKQRHPTLILAWCLAGSGGRPSGWGRRRCCDQKAGPGKSMAEEFAASPVSILPNVEAAGQFHRAWSAMRLIPASAAAVAESNDGASPTATIPQQEMIQR
jgi:hypothetical protein